MFLKTWSCDIQSIWDTFFHINIESLLFYDCMSLWFKIRLFAVFYSNAKCYIIYIADYCVPEVFPRFWHSSLGEISKMALLVFLILKVTRTVWWNSFSKYNVYLFYLPSPWTWRNHGIFLTKHQFEHITLTPALSDLDKRNFIPIKILCWVTLASQGLCNNLENTVDKHMIE